MKRKGKISRKTKETSISVDLNIDGKGKYKIDTGIGFLNHMLEQLSKHSSIDMSIKAKGDTHIDLHHTTEDTGIAIGEALKKALKKSVGIRRYAHAMIPMDETLSRVAIDISNRPYLICKVNFPTEEEINLFKDDSSLIVSKINNEISKNKKNSLKMLLQIHDELIFECLKKDENNVKKLIQNAMVSVSSSEYHKFSIPLEVGVNSGNNWGEAH